MADQVESIIVQVRKEDGTLEAREYSGDLPKMLLVMGGKVRHLESMRGFKWGDPKFVEPARIGRLERFPIGENCRECPCSGGTFKDKFDGALYLECDFPWLEDDLNIPHSARYERPTDCPAPHGLYAWREE